MRAVFALLVVVLLTTYTDLQRADASDYVLNEESLCANALLDNHPLGSCKPLQGGLRPRPGAPHSRQNDNRDVGSEQ